jgi:hypothetical protein
MLVIGGHRVDAKQRVLLHGFASFLVHHPHALEMRHRAAPGNSVITPANFLLDVLPYDGSDTPPTAQTTCRPVPARPCS